MDQWAEIGLSDAQVDISRGHCQLAAHGAHLQLPVGLDGALLADAGFQFEGEGAGAEAVEFADVQIERPQLQRDLFVRDAVDEMDPVVAQLSVA